MMLDGETVGWLSIDLLVHVGVLLIQSLSLSYVSERNELNNTFSFFIQLR